MQKQQESVLPSTKNSGCVSPPYRIHSTPQALTSRLCPSILLTQPTSHNTSSCLARTHSENETKGQRAQRSVHLLLLTFSNASTDFTTSHPPRSSRIWKIYSPETIPTLLRFSLSPLRTSFLASHRLFQYHQSPPYDPRSNRLGLSSSNHHGSQISTNRQFQFK